MASEDPLPAIFLVVPWGRRAAASRAPIKQPGSYPACVRVQAAAEPGFQEARLGPPRGPVPPGCCLPLWPRPIARQCHCELCQGEFHAGPLQAGPHPFTAHPHSHLGKGTGESS